VVDGLNRLTQAAQDVLEGRAALVEDRVDLAARERADRRGPARRLRRAGLRQGELREGSLRAARAGARVEAARAGRGLERRVRGPGRRAALVEAERLRRRLGCRRLLRRRADLAGRVLDWGGRRPEWGDRHNSPVISNIE